MKAAPEAQARLLDIQKVDTQILSLNNERKNLPELAQLAQAKVEWNALGAATIANNTKISDTEIEVDKAEKDLNPVRQRLEKNQKRIDDGSLGSKELNAMIDEVENLKRRVATLEDEQLEVMERLESLNAERDKLAKQRAEMQSAIKALLARKDELVGVLDKKLAAAQAERVELTAAFPSDLLALYERIRDRAGGIGVGKLEGKRCSGCQLDQSPQAMDHYNSAPKDEVVRCESCDRILIR
ncbi:MAG: hypothetical protein LBR21_08670 [Propionibacteriaceae bacterium]|jgi:predicted  nucleic acid-binding Zn-ribbon protein|nr:hypothetical protein [Propionibacteriaceae bacterium]